MSALNLAARRHLFVVASSLALLAPLHAAAAADAHAAPKAAAKGAGAHDKEDGHAAPAKESKEGKESKKDAAKDPQPEPAAASPAGKSQAAAGEDARQAKATPQDPMDRLRERLAEKLGAAPAPKAHANVVRVVNRPTSGDDHAAPAVRRSVSSGRTPSAAALAAAHLQSKEAPAAGHGGGGHAAHWSYKGEGGPENWGQMKSEFATCSTGQRQSPIDIRDGIRVQLDPVQFDYRPSGFSVVDNGHTVQVNLSPGNSIEVMGRRYDLLQFHFHRPSEERVNGRQFDMVAHLVHKDIDGRLAVVAVLLDRGSAHPLIQAVWNNLPLEKGEPLPARTALDMNALLPAERSYFTYMGSLTTPPCSEGVLWMVMKSPVGISTDQIAIFSRLYPMNARPIQSVSGRLIKESN
jgi:carbonic anhydrase